MTTAATTGTAADRNFQVATDRVTLKVAGVILNKFVSVSIARDLQDIAGVFRVEVEDDARLRRALPVWLGDDTGNQKAINTGQACELAIDGETVLIGTIEKLDLEWDSTSIGAKIAGRDRTGRLADCAALPDGPAQFRNTDLLTVARTVCDPFGIPVRADVDIGAPFELLALHPHETALTFLEKATRQRSVLLTSDGVGGLLLTRGGKTRGPASLILGDNMLKMGLSRDWTHRFSRYIVKGQSAKVHAGAGAAALDSSLTPADDGDSTDAPGPASTAAAGSIVMTGEAIDPEITEYRPHVRIVRTQSGMSSVQEQAEWALRVARGQSEQVHVTVLDWRDGPKRALWRPNQVVTVTDPYSRIDTDMLIAGVDFEFGQDGMKTVLRLAGVTAFDRINEAARRRPGHHRRHAAGQSGPLDSDLAPLGAS